MLKSKLVCSVSAVFIYVCLCTSQISNGRQKKSVTLAQAIYCNTCVLSSADAARHWCYGNGYQGCINPALSLCPAGSSSYTMNAECFTDGFSALRREGFVNCIGGCIGAGKTWCVIESPDSLVTETKCIERVHSAELWKGDYECLNGDIYNKCVDGLPGEVPADDTDLNPLPEFRTCSSCILQSNMGWCVSRQALYNSNFCLLKSEERKCKGTFHTQFGKNFGCPIVDPNFYLDFEPWNCKTCVRSDPNMSWCSQDKPVNQAQCIAAVDVSTKCSGGAAFSQKKYCTKPNEAIRKVHPLSKTCSFCKANGDKWCTRTEGSGVAAVTARLCVPANSVCPAGSTETMCDFSKPSFFTYLPEVSRNLPDKCSKCTGDHAWCVAPVVRTCLPKWCFGFLCPTAPTAAAPAAAHTAPTAEECTDDNENRLFEDHLLYLPQNCGECVKNKVGKWCITKLKSVEYQFCVPSFAEDLCVGATPKPSCKHLKRVQKIGRIPKLIPKNCEECVEKSGSSWCVQSLYGEKIRFCLSDVAVEAFCKNGVAFRHCQIAPEDKVVNLAGFAFEDKRTTKSEDEKETSAAGGKQTNAPGGTQTNAPEGKGTNSPQYHQLINFNNNCFASFGSPSLLAAVAVVVGFIFL